MNLTRIPSNEGLHVTADGSALVGIGQRGKVDVARGVPPDFVAIGLQRVELGFREVINLTDCVGV